MSRSRFALSALAAMLLAVPSLQAVELQSVAGTDTKLKVYGFVRVDATYFADSLQAAGPTTASSLFYNGNPADTHTLPTQNLVLGYAPSRLGFTSITPSANLGDITTKIEMDMNTAPWHTRLVQISIGNWTIGKAWSVWNDLDAGPDTVDWAGPVGGACFDTPRRPLIKYLAHFDKKNSLEIGIEQNGGQTDGTTPGATSKADGRYPNLVAAYTYGDTWGHIGLRGLEQNVAAYIPPTGTTSSSRYSSWEGAFQVSGAFNIAKDALVATLYTGKALGDYGTGIQSAVLNDTTQTVSAFKTTGWMAGYTHNWTDAVRSNLDLSGVSFSSDPLLPATAIKSMQSGSVNTIVKLTKSVELGMEYIYESAKTFGSQSAVDTDGHATDKNTGSKVEVSLTASF